MADGAKVTAGTTLRAWPRGLRRGPDRVRARAGRGRPHAPPAAPGAVRAEPDLFSVALRRLNAERPIHDRELKKIASDVLANRDYLKN